MFRFLGFHWNPADPTQAAAARQLDASLRREAGWRAALSIPGLSVHTIGTRPRINGHIVLPQDRGVILGRLFRRGSAHDGPENLVLSQKDGDRIAETDGRALVDDYWGRYVAVLRPAPLDAALLRDPSGALPCYRADVDGVAVFFSWLEDLIRCGPAALPKVDWDAIAARLCLGDLGGGRRTALHGVSEILPGQLTSLGTRAAAPVPLWSPVAAARRALELDPAQAAERLGETVRQCVQQWSSCYETILLRLSGGVDSAILLACLSERDGGRVTCLNYHSPGADSDERPYARLAADRAQVVLIERRRNADFRLDEVLAVSRTPRPESYVGRTGSGRIDAEVAAAQGAAVMFTGAGGDQLFFEVRSCWPAADYLRAHGWSAGFLHVALDSARLGQVSLLQSMWRASIDRHHRANLWADAGQWSTLTSRRALERVVNLDHHVHPELLAASDLPIGKHCQLQALINPCAYYDPYLVDAAPELVNPLLSQPLIELCLALPTWLLTHGGRGRALARRAFAKDIPREIATRQSKGSIDEHVASILQRNLPLARSLLLEGRLAAEGLLDRGKVEAALAGRLSAADECLAELHDCIAIEAWLRRFEAPTRTVAA